ncbi:chaoptin-like [Camponotus floridanus]|uniref:chaoptin-like n=1 Tax=Camponotus floridanus TaxID=104421 RepID=UPI000DC6CDA8|nr:chaoptin-like [Camponotus floridanus]
MFNYCNIIILLLLIVCNECLCDICKICKCVSNIEAIIDCHNRHLGINEDFNFNNLFTLDLPQTLEKLILSKNNIVFFPTNELKNLKYLKKLDLSQNNLSNIQSDIFKNLNDLEDLNYSHNLLWHFDISIINMDSSLSKFNLSHNQINSLEKSSENTITKLKVFDVSHNNLTNLTNLVNFFNCLPELEYLDLSFNQLSTLPPKSLLYLQHLKILYINNNHLLDLNLQNLPLSLLELYAGNNFINHLLLQKSSIHILNIQNNCISNIYKNLTLLEELKNLNINGNSLSEFPDVFLKDLDTLDLSFNNLTIIPETISVKNFPNLRILKVNGNRLKDVKIRSELRLKRFEINFVKTIEEIGKETFLMLRERENDCINITISNNIKLNIIEKNVFQHMNICSLDLSNNCFAHLPSELFDVNVSNAKYLINLQGNPFICDCSLQWMLNILVPKLYLMRPSLLEDLRCAGPPPLTDRRMVHWYKWKGNVFCNNTSHFAEKMIFASISNKQIVKFEISPGMIVALAMALFVLAILTTIGILLTQRIIVKKRRFNRRF